MRAPERRVEVLLGENEYRRLQELAAWRKAPLAETVREAVDRFYGELEKARRMEAVRRLGSLRVPIPPPRRLKREILEGLYGCDSAPRRAEATPGRSSPRKPKRSPPRSGAPR